MNSSDVQIVHKGYTIVKSLLHNERNEIILASRISDGQKVVLKTILIAQ